MIRFLTFIGLAAAAAGSAEAQPLHVIAVGEPTIGYLGIGYADINAESAKALKLPEEIGVRVTLIDPKSPAAAAGLRLDDVVVEYNGQRVEGQLQLTRLISETPPGREVRIQILRNGYSQNLVAKIGLKPLASPRARLTALALPGPDGIPDIPTPRMSWRNGLGAEWEMLDGQLAAFFGAKEGGVLVRSVAEGSAAEKAGLRAGDVIIRVGEARVATPTDVSAHIRAVRENSATVTLLRDRHEMTLTIPLESRQN